MAGCTTSSVKRTGESSIAALKVGQPQSSQPLNNRSPEADFPLTPWLRSFEHRLWPSARRIAHKAFTLAMQQFYLVAIWKRRCSKTRLLFVFHLRSQKAL